MIVGLFARGKNQRSVAAGGTDLPPVVDFRGAEFDFVVHLGVWVIFCTIHRPL